ncbi:LacI family DNA-binding transcriptional regulator [Deinococcus sp. A31D244]|uniref:LacI family DNA-binding transcriptional regulator n=1 Tax=Deinococcus sp. A31D244 TaxID=3397675 RepID=UPI0039E08360
MRPRTPVTLADVAALAGVSQQTVSRVVNNQPNVSARTRARVTQAAAQLDYVPNRLATSLARQRTFTVGFVTNDLALHAPSQLTSGIERAARAAGYSLIVSIVPHDTLPAVTQAVRALRERQVDGVLINASMTPADAGELLRRLPDLPCVFMDVTPDTPVPASLLDQEYGARLAAQHLLDLGHTRVAFITSPNEAIVENTREQGWQGVLHAHGLSPVARVSGDWSPHGGYVATQTLLAGPAFTALLVANDQMAVGALRALWERGLNVPADVSVIGYDDTPESALLIPPLTTVRQDFPTLGQRAFTHLLARLGGDPPEDVIVTRPELIIRASSGPPQTPARADVQAALRLLTRTLAARAHPPE